MVVEGRASTKVEVEEYTVEGALWDTIEPCGLLAAPNTFRDAVGDALLL